MTDITAAEVKSYLQQLFTQRQAIEKGLEIISKLEIAEQAESEIAVRVEAQKKLADGYEAKVMEANQIIVDAQAKGKQIVADSENQAKANIQKANDDINALVDKKTEAQDGLAAIQLKTEGANKEYSETASKIVDIKAELKTWEDKKAAFKASL